ncbi:superoxide dismutase family protein [Ureibacillus sp. FSL K6-8385]|uniref:Superoxide dismutase family protein n=1 Tax=Ureibacillus terrenus TaxID=118246 RepID=A0A540V5C6_9BACL|nr:superoxide dismutase family protein [Ureibacillus terrenus]MED3661109.1 superoxide dismutase family protein [Ureibacillus terrenus]MED3764413.1 superoxide dismutase family protein [Ureibacillus terrenus]TQE91918.1 superoxide dismutase family protein [Ureibacillus terrenus]
MEKFKIGYLSLCMLLIFLGGCGWFGAQNKDAEQIPTNAEPALTAKADMIDTKGKEVGTVEFTETSEGVRIHVKMENVPKGEHGFHIHEVGKCEKPGFESAGSHFNPLDREHGFENPRGFHAGDLPNIAPNEDGKVDVVFLVKNITLQKDRENSLFDEDGSSVVLHEKPDDYKTDPSGESGARIACGVIESN